MIELLLAVTIPTVVELIDEYEYEPQGANIAYAEFTIGVDEAVQEALVEQAEYEHQETARREEVASRQEQAPEQPTEGLRWEVWGPIARCESGYGGEPQWDLNSGNGFYGGLQFTLDSWQWVGGEGYPHHASPEEQIKRAEILLERQGWRAWPVCSRKVGYR